ncbi:hypothetical protein HETIRDRAFT_381745 [Heterobasidion irregulare TC 32-1]|uniref:Uncharacterized protein n=1 Tax=Heterobasidion irregulare (strain TC 32-1) TaxID=747525 RepID=W4KGX6_HETIT|nr:uncharacterized protein HETIRDRAFT_381745 [Heterobasidion irregulare TC 32-1]ETW84281.1 hypothetical protein HETIRDRAFT_381745 [Heterobasidion irregulare TC 32-1]
MNPFGMRAGARNDKDLQILSGWLGEIFGRRISVSAVYTMSTKDYIIVQLPMDLDVLPIVGCHKWTEFLTKWDNSDSPESLIFQYNYRKKGDPADNNWVIRTSRDVSPPDGIFVKPYPSPSWAAVPPQLSNYNMVLPLPPHLKRPSTPPAEVAPKLENEPQVKPEVKAEVVDVKPFGPKLDPYEAEDLALQSLQAVKSEPMDNIMTEPSYHDYAQDNKSGQPSLELQEAFARYQATESQVFSAHSIKSEPSDPQHQRLARSEGEGSTIVPDPEKERVKLERGLPHHANIKMESNEQSEPSQRLREAFARYQAAQTQVSSVDHSVKSEPLDPRQYQSGSQSFGRHPENALNRSEEYSSQSENSQYSNVIAGKIAYEVTRDPRQRTRPSHTLPKRPFPTSEDRNHELPKKAKTEGDS